MIIAKNKINAQQIKEDEIFTFNIPKNLILLVFYAIHHIEN